MPRSRIRYIRWYPDEWLAGTFGKLTLEEKGLYIEVISMIVSRGGPIDFDLRHLGHASLTNARTIGRVLDRLVALGKLKIEDGKLTNGRALADLDEARSRATSSTRGRSNNRQTSPNVSGNHSGMFGGSRGPVFNDFNDMTSPRQEPVTSNCLSDRQDADAPGHGGWQPSRAAVATARGRKPWLTDAIIAEQTDRFRQWVQKQGIELRDPEASWLAFIDRTRRPKADRMDADGKKLDPDKAFNL